MQDIEMFREVPGYRAILRAVIKHQIQGLIYQLARHTGEESVLITASVEEGTLTHLGSDHGKVFLDTREELKAQFLGFCLKRNQMTKSGVHQGDQFMRKKGPYPARNRPISNKAFTSGVRHQPYPTVPVVKTEPADPSAGELKPVNYSREKYTNQPKNHCFDSVKPVNLSMFPNNEYGVKIKSEKMPEASVEHNGQPKSPSHCGEGPAADLHTVPAQGSLSTVSQPIDLAQTKEANQPKVSTPEPKENVNEIEMPELVNEKEVNQNNEELANRNVEHKYVRKTELDGDRPASLTGSPLQTSPGVAEPAELPRTDDLASVEAPDYSTIGAYHYTLATSYRKSRKSHEPRKKAPPSNPPLMDTDVKPPTSNSQLKEADTKTPPSKLMESEMNGQDSDVEKSAQQRKQELESYLCLDHSTRPYPCNLCPKRFKERHHLIYHIRTHSGQRPYKCLTCGKAFTQSSSLNTHKKTHFKDISCGECGLLFKKQMEFMNHACHSSQGSLILS